MPWLSQVNPDIDWKKRTIHIGNRASTDKGEYTEHSDLRNKTSKKKTERHEATEVDKENTKANPKEEDEY